MFKTSLPVILKFEGGYSNHKDDPGGATMKGVTQVTYDAYRKTKKLEAKAVKDIADAEVEDIYRGYWIGAGCDEFCDSHPLTALIHFDFAINAGPKQASKVLQKALGVTIDGVLGKQSLGVILKSKDEQLAIRYLDFRENFYRDLTVQKPTLKTFLKGWLNRTAHLRRIVNDRASANKAASSISSTA